MSHGIEARLREARSWADFQALLRQLHIECGSPKYDAVSARGGLPKSAVSGLIGRNPQRRPTEATSLRFVSACLALTGTPEATVADSVETWRSTWRRLASQEDAAAPDISALTASGLRLPEPAGIRSGPRRRTRVLALALVCLLAFGLGAAAWHQLGPVDDGVPVGAPVSPEADTTPAAADTGACMAGEAKIPDARLKRDWDGVFICDNKRALVYRWASVDGMPTALLRTNPSWLICWTRGQEVGGEDVWYYTQGDDALTDPPIPSTWGFIPASDVLVPEHPAPGVTRRCPFPVTR